jgi:hypothetical protein
LYAKLCNIEILSSYIKDVSVGDMLTVQALITNPLDWQHFYEKISTMKKGEKTDFTVVTWEGDRLVGTGNIVEVNKWSNRGQYGFKIKIDVKHQKSLTERRVRGPGRTRSAEKPTAPLEAKSPQVVPLAAATITPQDIAAFREMLKGSVAMDMA